MNTLKVVVSLLISAWHHTSMVDGPPETAPQANLIQDPDVLDSYGRDVSGMEGIPDWLLRPRDEQEICEVVKWARSERVTLLPVGSQTSTTGSSVATGGVVIDLKSMIRPPELDTTGRVVRVSAGANLQALQDFLRTHQLELPPDPTSAPDCTVGGAVATNASGPSTFRYGPMASFVRGLRVVDGTGACHYLRRPGVEKSAMGPVNLQDPTRFFVGAEGLLGAIVQVELTVLPLPPVVTGVFVGFPSRVALFSAVKRLRAERRRLALRAVEWLDRNCCGMLAENPGRIILPQGEGGGLYVELEGDEAGVDRALEEVASLLEGEGGDMSAAQIFQGPAAIRAFDELRHRVPDTMNHRGAARKREAGGGKLSTDWSVPLDAMEDLLRWTENALQGVGLDGCYSYGHIGNGHPHQNLICPNAEVRAKAHDVLKDQLRRVVEAGGVPTSEHGIGKIKRDLVRPYLPPGFRATLLALKKEFDPDNLFAPGNIL